MNKGRIHITILLILLSLTAHPQEYTERLIQLDTLVIKKKVQLVGIPVAFYTPETEFGFGAGAQFFLLNQTNIYNSRLSNILATAIYTTKEQLILDVRPQVYFNAGDLFLDGILKYQVYPNLFWGVGRNTPDSNREQYNMKTFQLSAALLKRLPPSLNFGFEYNFENYDMLEVEEDGLLDRGDIPGSEGATISGLSFVFNLDDRDDISSAVRGNLIQLKAGFSSHVFGATYSFNRYVIDLRKYLNFIGRNTLAMQVYIQSNYGDVPFQSLAWLGGGEKMRGYFRGRYMDKHMYVLQSEYRWRFHKRFTQTGFVSLGEVSGSAGAFLRSPLISTGGGLRFKVLKDKSTIVRLDIGIGQSGNSGFYFGVNEAF